METIKYLYWDSKYSRMWTVKSIGFDGYIYYGPYHTGYESGKHNLCMFTGLTFGGIDIYTGDIIACEGGYEGNECENPSEVYFDIDTLQFRVKCLCGCGGTPLYEYDIYKVLGNVKQYEQCIDILHHLVLGEKSCNGSCQNKKHE